MLDWLQGKKTYILAALVALVSGAQYAGLLSNVNATALYGVLGAGSLAALRAGISKP